MVEVDIRVFKVSAEDGSIHEICTECHECETCDDCVCDTCTCDEEQTLADKLGIDIEDDFPREEDEEVTEDEYFHDKDKHVDEDIGDMLQLIRYYTLPGSFGEEVLKTWEKKYL